MSNLLREEYSLTKLREELKGRKRKLCQCCKKFGHLACCYAVSEFSAKDNI